MPNSYLAILIISLSFLLLLLFVLLRLIVKLKQQRQSFLSLLIQNEPISAYSKLIISLKQNYLCFNPIRNHFLKQICQEIIRQINIINKNSYSHKNLTIIFRLYVLQLSLIYKKEQADKVLQIIQNQQSNLVLEHNELLSKLHELTNAKIIAKILPDIKQNYFQKYISWFYEFDKMQASDLPRLQENKPELIDLYSVQVNQIISDSSWLACKQILIDSLCDQNLSLKFLNKIFEVDAKEADLYYQKSSITLFKNLTINLTKNSEIMFAHIDNCFFNNDWIFPCWLNAVINHLYNNQSNILPKKYLAYQAWSQINLLKDVDSYQAIFCMIENYQIISEHMLKLQEFESLLFTHCAQAFALSVVPYLNADLKSYSLTKFNRTLAMLPEQYQQKFIKFFDFIDPTPLNSIWDIYLKDTIEGRAKLNFLDLFITDFGLWPDLKTDKLQEKKLSVNASLNLAKKLIVNLQCTPSSEFSKSELNKSIKETSNVTKISETRNSAPKI